MAEKVRCEICGHVFKNQDGFEQHNAAVHGAGSAAKENKDNKKKEDSLGIGIEKKWIYGILFFIIVVIAFVFMLSKDGVQGVSDEFVKCLKEKGAVMYGAFWCPHCAEQKKLFGGSAKYLNYVECSTSDRQGQTAVCIKEKIESYPTWKFADGAKITEILSLQQLSQRTGCALPLSN